jgi:hypothetical protein
MSTKADRATGRRSDAAASAADARALTAAEVAWIALPPCALLSLAAILVLGPPLGEALFAPGGDPLWPVGWWNSAGNPEPAKHGRYLVATVAPLLLVAAVLGGMRRAPLMRSGTIRAGVLASEALVVGFVGFAVLVHHNVIVVGQRLEPVWGLGAALVAAALVATAAVALRRRAVAERIGALARETPARRIAALAVATLFAAAWLVEAVTTDRLSEDFGVMTWTLNDAFAVLNGRTPLVDYHNIYGKLVPYPAALALAAFGTTALVYTLILTLVSLLAMLAVYAVFRRVVRSSALALALFLPFVAASAIGHVVIQAGLWPMRYAGAYLMIWLTARQVDGAWPRQPWVLFFVGGLVAINTIEFGVGAVVATLAALLCARPPADPRAALRLCAEAAAGLLAAVAAVAALTLARAGELPKPELFTEWPRIFTDLGWFSAPLPTIGMHLALYATFAAAIAAATVRLARAAEDRLLTSMLAWSGFFGLLAGGYFVGRPDQVKLYAMVSAWSLALGLLTVVCVRALSARDWRRPAPAQLLVLFGFALTVCLIGRLPAPQDQVERLTRSTRAPTYRPYAKEFVRQRTRPGETVVILLPMGFRIAHELGLKNVAPYVVSNAIVTRGQMRTVIETARQEGVRSIFIPQPGTLLTQEIEAPPEHLGMLASAGFRQGTEVPGLIELRRGG